MLFSAFQCFCWSPGPVYLDEEKMYGYRFSWFSEMIHPKKNPTRFTASAKNPTRFAARSFAHGRGRLARGSRSCERLFDVRSVGCANDQRQTMGSRSIQSIHSFLVVCWGAPLQVTLPVHLAWGCSLMLFLLLLVSSRSVHLWFCSSNFGAHGPSRGIPKLDEIT